GERESKPSRQLRLHGSTAEGDGTNRAQVATGKRRMFEHPGRHGRHRAPDRDSFPLDQVEHLVCVETALEEDDGVTAECGQQQSLKSTDVEHGTALQDHGAWLVWVELMRQAPGHEQKAVEVGDNRAMGEDGGLWIAGGAGGEYDHGRLAFVAAA